VPSETNFCFAKPNELAIILNTIGFVQRPGRYEISNETDLINLMPLVVWRHSGRGNVRCEYHAGHRMRRAHPDAKFHLNLEHTSQDSVTTILDFNREGDGVQIEKIGCSPFYDTFAVVVAVQQFRVSWRCVLRKWAIASAWTQISRSKASWLCVT